ncbi:hypothetical protein L613_005200000150 [Pseudoxanthomonas taiwanensis J19]|uniref:CopL family metal-binding regulatory protein n=1 Tax=Pseudoxanthomonas taiwanensis J19 TaxID=935569 RepID=A0A562D7D5_9GAMM|nr:hypothetical protein [Pseudoxanthomonas sp. J31]TWH05669.1 hypothetical protein L613_005200000150 [Pseudoxanthomonas taiwanensis J19]
MVAVAPVLAYRGRVRTDPTMTGFLPRLSALLLLLCLLAGGLPAQAMHAPAPSAGAAHADAMHGCHDAGATAAPAHGDPVMPAPSAGDCCEDGGCGGTGGCGLACACPLAAAAPAPPACAIGKSTAAAPPAAPECGDPGRVPVPPRRPPIA